MAIAPKSIGSIVVPNAATVLYASPTGVTTVITRAFVNNVSAGAVDLTLWLVRSGGARADSNLIHGASVAGIPVSAGPSGPLLLNELAGLVLAPGDALHGLASAATSLNFVASGWTQ